MKKSYYSSLIAILATTLLAACGGGSPPDDTPSAPAPAPHAVAKLIFISVPFTGYAAGQVFQVRGEGTSYDYVRLDAARKVLALAPTAQTIQLDDGSRLINCTVLSGAVTACENP